MTNYYIEDSGYGQLLQQDNSTTLGACGANVTDYDKANPFCLRIQLLRSATGACNKDCDSTGLELHVDKDGGGYQILSSSELSGYACSGISDEGSQATDNCGTPDSGCASGFDGSGIQTTDGVTSHSITKEYYSIIVIGLDASGGTPGSTYSFQIWDSTNNRYLTSMQTLPTITLASEPATQLVHTDGGEDYCLTDDNDGDPIVVTETVIYTLVHTNAGEDYLLLDDNDGNALDLAQHFLTTAECYNLLDDNDGTAIDLGAITLVSTEECYSLLDDNDGNPITVEEAVGATQLVHTDGGEDYLLHYTDEPNVYSMDIAEAYHLVDDNDGSALDFGQHFLTTAEMYHLVDDNDGSAVTLGNITLETTEECYNLIDDNDSNPLDFGQHFLTTAECYHEHYVDPCQPKIQLPISTESYHLVDDNDGNPLDLAQHFLTTADCYHLHVIDPCNVYSIAIAECYHLLDDNDGNPLSLAGVANLANLDSYHLLDDNDGNALEFNQHFLTTAECYHLHDLDPCNLANITLVSTEECYHVHDAQNIDEDMWNQHFLITASLYHLLDDNDGNPIAIAQTGSLEISPCVHLHYADEPNVYSLVPDETYHLHDAENISLGGVANLIIVGDYCLHDVDGDLTLTGLHILDPEECYHLHDVDPSNVTTVISLTIAECYHLHDGELIDLTQTHTLAMDEDYLAIIDDGPFSFVENEVLVISAVNHSVDSGSVYFSFTAWGGTGSLYESKSKYGRNYRILLDAADIQYGESDGYLRVRLIGSPTAEVTIDGVSIGRKKASSDPYDYDTSSIPHVRLTFDGSNSVTLPIGTLVWSDWVVFPLDQTKDHLLHLYLNAGHKYPYRTTTLCYMSTDRNDQTMIADVSGYNTISEALFVTAVEVRPRTSLTIAEAYSNIVSDTFGVGSTMVIPNAYHDHEADSKIVLTQSNTLDVEESYHLNAVDSCDLIVPTDLVIAESYHDMAVDALTLTQEHTLSIDEADNLQFSDNLDLSGLQDLTVAEAYHDCVVDPVELTQSHTLVVAECYHSHTVERVAISSNDAVGPKSTYHNHVVDGIALVQDFYLTVNDSYHVIDSEMNEYTLIINDAYHIHRVDPITLTSATGLPVVTIDRKILSQTPSRTLISATPIRRFAA